MWYYKIRFKHDNETSWDLEHHCDVQGQGLRVIVVGGQDGDEGGVGFLRSLSLRILRLLGVRVPMEPTLIERQHPVAYACGEDADARAGNDIVQPMAVVVHPQERNACRHRIGGQPIPRAVFDTHQFRPRKHQGRMSGRKGVAGARVRAFLANGIFETVGKRGHDDMGGGARHKTLLERVFRFDTHGSQAQISRRRQVLDVVVRMEIMVAPQAGQVVLNGVLEPDESSVVYADGADTYRERGKYKLFRCEPIGLRVYVEAIVPGVCLDAKERT